MNSSLKLFLIILGVRILSCGFLMINYDYPDEYWQGPQVAHRMSFGYGYLTWQWTLQHPIRSYLFPSILSLFYELVKLLHLSDCYLCVLFAPTVYQIIVASTFDWYLIKLNSIYNPQTTKTVLLLNYICWATMTLISRTYINSTEALLTLIAYYYWMKRAEKPQNDLISRAIVVFAFVMRGTSLMFWAIVWPYELFTMRGTLMERFKFILKNLLTIVVMVGLSLWYSYVTLGKWQLVEYNFYYYNMQLKWSEIYGKHAFFQYFFAFFPGLLAGLCPYFIVGLASIVSPSSEKVVDGLSKGIFGWSSVPTDEQPDKKKGYNAKLKEMLLHLGLIMLFLSISVHKEPRFLTFLLPLALIVCVRGYTLIPHKIILLIAIVINVTVFYAINIYGRHGPIDVLKDIRDDPKLDSVIFIMECHSTPYYSVLHRNVTMRFPDCSPITRVHGKSENDQFFKNPKPLYQKFQSQLPKPASHVLVSKNEEALIGIDHSLYEKVRQYKNVPLFYDILEGDSWFSLYRLKDEVKHEQIHHSQKL